MLSARNTRTFASRVKGEFELPAGESGQLVGASGKGLLQVMAIVVMIERGNVCLHYALRSPSPIPLHCAHEMLNHYPYRLMRRLLSATRFAGCRHRARGAAIDRPRLERHRARSQSAAVTRPRQGRQGTAGDLLARLGRFA